MEYKVGTKLKVLDKQGDRRAVIGETVEVVEEFNGTKYDLVCVKNKAGIRYSMCAMRFEVIVKNKKLKVGDEVITKSFIDADGHGNKARFIKDKTVGIIRSINGNHCTVKFNVGTPQEDWWNYTLEDLELASKPTEFKVGDEVKVANLDGRDGSVEESLGKTGIISRVDNDCAPYRVEFEELDDFWFYTKDELELVKEPMTYREALLHTLNGTMKIRHTSMPPGMHLGFSDGIKYGGTSEYCDANHWNCKEGHWEEYIVSTPPKFTKKSIIRNSVGDLGIIKEDKGIIKGTRRYLVSFNALDGSPLKTVAEAELAAVML